MNFNSFYFATFTTRDAVKDEYRRLCRLRHPDLFAHESAEIQAAQTRLMQQTSSEYARAMDELRERYGSERVRRDECATARVN